MNIYNKLSLDLQNIVKFHLNKHLDIHYLIKISKNLYFSNITKIHVKEKINILIKNIKALNIYNIDYKFKFPYNITKEDGNYGLRYYKILDYNKDDFYKISFPKTYER